MFYGVGIVDRNYPGSGMAPPCCEDDSGISLGWSRSPYDPCIYVPQFPTNCGWEWSLEVVSSVEAVIRMTQIEGDRIIVWTSPDRYDPLCPAIFAYSEEESLPPVGCKWPRRFCVVPANGCCDNETRTDPLPRVLHASLMYCNGLEDGHHAEFPLTWDPEVLLENDSFGSVKGSWVGSADIDMVFGTITLNVWAFCICPSLGCGCGAGVTQPGYMVCYQGIGQCVPPELHCNPIFPEYCSCDPFMLETPLETIGVNCCSAETTSLGWDLTITE